VALNLGAGNEHIEGFTSVDLHADKADLRIDLFRPEWPEIETDSVDVIYSSHFLEHVPNWDSFWKEVFRITKDGATSIWRTPYYLSVGCWQDPTHKQAISLERYYYLIPKAREQMDVAHYMDDVHFEEAYEPWWIYDPEWEMGKSDEAKAYARKHIPNACREMIMFLKTVKNQEK